MKAKELHPWKVGYEEAVAIQRHLAGLVSTRDEVGEVRLVAGADISAERNSLARAAVVVLSYPELEPAEVKTVEGKPSFPYIPGLLSFRETPLVLSALEQLISQPDLLLVDGQGLAHPRRLGIACHLGLLLGLPTIGCAKSILRGHNGPLDPEPGSSAFLVDNGEVVGAALRTRKGIAPVYVSIGHRVDLEAALKWTLACCRGYRQPEPLRLAHLAAGGSLPPREAAGVKVRQKKLF